MLIYSSLARKRRHYTTHYHHYCRCCCYYYFVLFILYYNKYSTMINVFKSKQTLRRYSWTKVHVKWAGPQQLVLCAHWTCSPSNSHSLSPYMCIQRCSATYIYVPRTIYLSAANWQMNLKCVSSTVHTYIHKYIHITCWCGCRLPSRRRVFPPFTFVKWVPQKI